jgi:hypothetical protein
VQAGAARYRKKDLRPFTIPAGEFTVYVATPYVVQAAMKLHEDALGADKRIGRDGLSDDERFADLREYRDWVDDVGFATAPVFSVSVMPLPGQTMASSLTHMMVTPLLLMSIRFDFQSDIREVSVYRDGQLVAPFVAAHARARLVPEMNGGSKKDRAQMGCCVVGLEALRPDSLGTPPSVVIAVRNERHFRKLYCTELDPELVARAWNDFADDPGARRGGAPVVHADATRARKRRRMAETKFLKGKAEWFAEPERGPR